MMPEAIDPATGETLWRQPREGFGSGWSTPVHWRRGDVDELLQLLLERKRASRAAQA